MRVNELIQQLQQFDSDALIVVDGYEDGVVEPLAPKAVRLRLNVFQEEYYGPHQVMPEGENDSSTVQAVYLARTSSLSD